MPPESRLFGSLGRGGGGVRDCVSPLQQDSSLTSFDPHGGLRLKGPPFGPLPAGCWSIRWTCRTSASQLSGQSVCCDRSGPLTGCPVSDPLALSPWMESPQGKYENPRSHPYLLTRPGSQGLALPGRPHQRRVQGELGPPEPHGDPTPGCGTVGVTWKDSPPYFSLIWVRVTDKSQMTPALQLEDGSRQGEQG